MRLSFLLIIGLSALVITGCSHANSTANLNTTAAQTAQSGNSSLSTSVPNSVANSTNAANVGAASGHRSLPGSATSPTVTQDSQPDTSALDAKIKQAEARAKSRNATEADRKAAATAYLERANVFYGAQTSSLYKYALGDFRRALKYDPSNQEARAKSEQIIAIYKSMDRPVPENGLEP